jgi:hypothetical protein
MREQEEPNKREVRINAKKSNTIYFAIFESLARLAIL